MGWNAWDALRERPHVRLRICDLPDATGGGVLARRPAGTVILLDRRLSRVERHAVLAHELIHEERDRRYGGVRFDEMPTLWHSRVAIDEKQVDREVARRLVPVDQLAEFSDRMADLGEGVGPDEVMHEFDCTRRVAEDALDNLKRHERGTR